MEARRQLIRVDHGTPTTIEGEDLAARARAPALLVLRPRRSRTSRRGFYAVSRARSWLPLARRTGSTAGRAHHAPRFPVGIDLIAPSASSDALLQGEWEQNAKHTALQLAHWTMILAGAGAAIAAFAELRRRRGKRPIPVPPPPESAMISSPQAPSS